MCSMILSSRADLQGERTLANSPPLAPFHSDSSWPGCGAVKMCKPHLCKHFALKCANNHICANMAPSNVQTTTFVQTWRPQNNVQFYKSKKKIHQPLMCKHDVKCAKVKFWRKHFMCKHPTNVQIVFINPFTSTKFIDGRLIPSQTVKNRILEQARRYRGISGRTIFKGGHKTKRDTQCRSLHGGSFSVSRGHETIKRGTRFDHCVWDIFSVSRGTRLKGHSISITGGIFSARGHKTIGKLNFNWGYFFSEHYVMC